MKKLDIDDTMDTYVDDNLILSDTTLGKSSIRLTIYNEIDGTIYKMLYINKSSQGKLFFKNIKQMIISNAISQMDKSIPYNESELFIKIDTTRKNTVYITNHAPKRGHNNIRGYLDKRCVLIYTCQ